MNEICFIIFYFEKKFSKKVRKIDEKWRKMMKNRRFLLKNKLKNECFWIKKLKKFNKN